MQEVQISLPVGTVVQGRYVVERLLGKGSSGSVYLVRDQRVRHTMRNLFALKEVIAPDQHERNCLIFETAVLNQPHHQASPRIYRTFYDNEYDRMYLLMEYIDGSSLETLRQQQLEKRFTWLKAITLMAPIIDAVDYLHSQRSPVIHCDIKPANIIISKVEVRTVLVDFGIMKEHNPDSVTFHSSTHPYRAPEQYSRRSNTRTDIYGLGATFYTLLTGQVPVDAPSRMRQLENGKIDPLSPANEVMPAVPTHIARVIHRAMSVHAHNRFSSVERFWEALWETVNPSQVDRQLPIPDHKPTASTARPVIPKYEPATIQPATSSVSSQQPRALHEEKHDAPWPFAQKHTPVKPAERQERSTAKQDAPLAQKHTALKPAAISVPKQRRASRNWKPAIVFVLLALLIGLGIGAVLLSHASIRPAAHTAAPIPTIRPSASRPAPAPTSISTIYPTIAGRYNGTIYDLSANVSTSFTLTGVQQSQGKISGYLNTGSRLQESSSFSGTIDTAKHFQFTATDPVGHATLFFEGAVQSATTLSGDFYHCTPNPAQSRQCTRAPGGYGIWSAVLAS